MEELKILKAKLRKYAKEKGDAVVLEVAQGQRPANVTESEIYEIRGLYKEILAVDNLADVDITDLLDVLQPDSLIERLAYRKQNRGKDFVKLKGVKGQIENTELQKVTDPNEQIGFKCLHYSVAESSGNVEVTIIKKSPNLELTFGYRTIADTAVAPKDYTHVDEVITMKKREAEKVIYIPIVDDDEWEPDLDFYIELYDPAKQQEDPENSRLPGDDTKCKVTILDEDYPG